MDKVKFSILTTENGRDISNIEFKRVDDDESNIDLITRASIEISEFNNNPSNSKAGLKQILVQSH